MYALGIVGSFTGLGLVCAAMFGASGLARFSANPAVNLFFAALFVAFALSLFGVLHIALPASLASRAASQPLRFDTLGALAMGAVFTITAFTCTAPFVGTLLVMSAQGNWKWPLAGMIAFSTAFAAPFFVVALVPSILRRRPRSGEWMRTLELVVGTVEIAAAIKFASNADLVLGWGILTRRVVIALWIALLGALVLAILRTNARRRMRLVTVGATLPVVALLFPGLMGKRLGELDAFLPPMPAGVATSADGELPWRLNDYPAALIAAAKAQRPILIDFTGYTCTNCRWMEANMFPRPEVRAALSRFVRVRLYTDGLGEPYVSQQRMEQTRFGTVALPLYAVLDANGNARATFLGMTRDVQEFETFLSRATVTR